MTLSVSLFCRVKKAILWIYVMALIHQFPRLFDQVSYFSDYYLGIRQL